MKKLELRHLATYLPYDLRCSTCELTNKPAIFILQKLSKDFVYGQHINKNGYYQDLPIDEIKPILKPLSDLTKEIEHNREKFVPIIELAKIADCHFKLIPEIKEVIEYEEDECNILLVNYKDNRYDSFEMSWGIDENVKFDGKNDGFTFVLGENNACHNIGTIYEKLFKWHFDCFNLINNGLAVDINIIKS